MIYLKITIISLIPYFFIMSSAWAKLPADCGSLYSSTMRTYGPFDYASAFGKKKLPVVESHHFTAKVEQLISGQEGSLPGDLHYTLRAFPNHHRALYSIIKYENSNRKNKKKLKLRAECYFLRAETFQSKDPIVWMLHGIYQQRLGNYEQALKKYKKALIIDSEYAELHYNTGLLYFKMGNYGLAKKHAQKAYKLKYPLPGLKKKLQKAGKW